MRQGELVLIIQSDVADFEGIYDMKRKIALAIGVFLLSTMVEGCTAEQKEGTGLEALVSSVEEGSDQIVESTETSIVENQESSEDDQKALEESESGESDEIIPKKEYSAEPSSQLQLLTDQYEVMAQEYMEAIYMGQAPKVAVADLNRNGRLELIFTDCQGTGGYSYTSVYEISEDYSSVLHMPNGNEDGIDEIGDFLLQDVFECYKKGDSYYYQIWDYTSAGWSCKGKDYYAYSFDGTMEPRKLGGFMIETKGYDHETFYVSFWDKDDVTLPEEESFAKNFETQWEGYEKQSGCEVKWMPTSYLVEDDIQKFLTESYEGFHTDVEIEDDGIDYRLVGDDYNYIIGQE